MGRWAWCGILLLLCGCGAQASGAGTSPTSVPPTAPPTRAAPSPTVTPPAGPPFHIESVSAEGSPVAPSSVVTLDYTIEDNTGAKQDAVLGASIDSQSDASGVFSDPADDASVTLSPGVHSYQRKFSVPAAAAGETFDVVASVNLPGFAKLLDQERFSGLIDVLPGEANVTAVPTVVQYFPQETPTPEDIGQDPTLAMPGSIDFGTGLDSSELRVVGATVNFDPGSTLWFVAHLNDTPGTSVTVEVTKFVGSAEQVVSSAAAQTPDPNDDTLADSLDLSGLAPGYYDLKLIANNAVLAHGGFSIGQ